MHLSSSFLLAFFKQSTNVVFDTQALDGTIIVTARTSLPNLTHYTLEYKQDESARWSTVFIYEFNADTSFKYRIWNLLNHRLYNVRLTAHFENGSTEQSAIKTLTPTPARIQRRSIIHNGLDITSRYLSKKEHARITATRSLGEDAKATFRYLVSSLAELPEYNDEFTIRDNDKRLVNQKVNDIYPEDALLRMPIDFTQNPGPRAFGRTGSSYQGPSVQMGTWTQPLRTAFSILAWTRRSQGTNNIINIGGAAFPIRLTHGDRIQFDAGLSVGFDYVGHGYAFVAVTVGAERMRLYIDGVEVASRQTPSRLWNNRIDGGVNYGDITGDGYIDNVSLHASEFTHNDIVGIHRGSAYGYHVFGGIARNIIEERETRDWVNIDATVGPYQALFDDARITERYQPPSNTNVATIVNTILDRWAIHQFTRDIRSSDVIAEEVFDHVSLTSALDTLAQLSKSIWWVSSDRVFHFIPRSQALNTTIVLNDVNVKKVRKRTNRSKYRSTSTVIGGVAGRGERRQDFRGQQRFVLNNRVDRIISVSLNGAEQTFSQDAADNTQWYLQGRELIRRAGDGNIGPADVLSVLYDANFNVIETVTSARALQLYGHVHRVEQNSALEDAGTVKAEAQSYLDRHDNPTIEFDTELVLDHGLGLEEGSLPRFNAPKYGYPNELYLADRLSISMFGVNSYRYNATLILKDHESRSKELYRKIFRITAPTAAPAIITDATGGSISTTPEILGLKLPKNLGGTESARRRRQVWERIYQGAIIPLNGRRLPSNLVQWSATVRVRSTGDRGEVRLVRMIGDAINLLQDEQVGGVAEVTSTTPVSINQRRLTLVDGLHNYYLQARLASGTGGVYVWGADIEAGN